MNALSSDGFLTGQVKITLQKSFPSAIFAEIILFAVSFRNREMKIILNQVGKEVV